jgi:hypothetical protein
MIDLQLLHHQVRPIGYSPGKTTATPSPLLPSSRYEELTAPPKR